MAKWIRQVGCLMVLLLGVARAQEAVRTLPEAPPAMENVLVYAQAKGLEIGRLSAPVNRGPETGDHAVALISLVDGKDLQQWLLEIEVAEALPPNLPPPADLTLYVTTGQKVEFHSSYVPVNLRLHGPFKRRQKLEEVEVKATTTVVNGEHLALGLDRAAKFALQMREKGGGSGAGERGIGFSTQPYTPEALAEGRRAAEGVAFTDEDVRAVAGTGPALVGFLDVVDKTPALKDILWDVIDLPIWSMIKSGGKTSANFNIDGGGVAEAPPRANFPPMYILPAEMKINDRTALKLSLLATSPQPPLLTTAGIIAVFAEHPKRKDLRAVVQILGARTAK